MSIKVSNLINKRNRAVANQFIIKDGNKTIFQSYDSIIAIKESGKPTILGKNWHYSKTTDKHRCLFLNESIKETRRKINSNEYIVDESL